MAARGRPPKSPELKRLLGNPGKRPIKESVTVRGVLTPPKQMRAEALAVWKSVVGALPERTYAATDANTLAVLCEAVADYWDAAKTIIAEGRYVKTPTTIVQHPAVKDKNEQARLIYTYSQRLYLDPVARNSLTANDPSGSNGLDADPFAGLIQ
jgi:P27 family predicted phage terminase small subunit